MPRHSKGLCSEMKHSKVNCCTCCQEQWQWRLMNVADVSQASGLAQAQELLAPNVAAGTSELVSEDEASPGRHQSLHEQFWTHEREEAEKRQSLPRRNPMHSWHYCCRSRRRRRVAVGIEAAEAAAGAAQKAEQIRSEVETSSALSSDWHAAVAALHGGRIARIE